MHIIIKYFTTTLGSLERLQIICNLFLLLILVEILRVIGLIAKSRLENTVIVCISVILQH